MAVSVINHGILMDHVQFLMTEGASFHSHAVGLILNNTPWYHFAIKSSELRKKIHQQTNVEIVLLFLCSFLLSSLAFCSREV